MDSTLVALNKRPTAVVFICPSNRHGVNEPVESLMFKSFGLIEISTKVFSFHLFFFMNVVPNRQERSCSSSSLLFEVKQQSLLNKKYFAALLLV